MCNFGCYDRVEVSGKFLNTKTDWVGGTLYFFFFYTVSHFILDVKLVDAPDGVTQEGHTDFLHLPSAVLALFFIARRIQPSLSLVDRGVDFLCAREIIVLHLLGMILEKIPVRVTAPRFELTSQRQKVSRFPTEPPGRPARTFIHFAISNKIYDTKYERNTSPPTEYV